MSDNPPIVPYQNPPKWKLSPSLQRSLTWPFLELEIYDATNVLIVLSSQAGSGKPVSSMVTNCWIKIFKLVLKMARLFFWDVALQQLLIRFEKFRDPNDILSGDSGRPSLKAPFKFNCSFFHQSVWRSISLSSSYNVPVNFFGDVDVLNKHPMTNFVHFHNNTLLSQIICKTKKPLCLYMASLLYFMDLFLFGWRI